MSATATLSIRVPLQTRRWLERFAKRRGSAGMAASRILEEARRREDYPVDFRDTPLGRVAYVQGTRVQAALVYGQVERNPELAAEKLASSFAWPLWKARGALAYINEFTDECRQEWEDLESAEWPELRRILPGAEYREVGVA